MINIFALNIGGRWRRVVKIHYPAALSPGKKSRFPLD